MPQPQLAGSGLLSALGRNRLSQAVPYGGEPTASQPVNITVAR
jgi:hypothetical protein